YSDPAFVNNEYKVETIRGRDGSFSYIRLPHFKRDFGGISGIYYIDENKSEAIVEFTELNEKLKYYGVKAPEIQGIPLKARDRGLEVEAVAKKKVAMRRYDDGWRVVATSPRFE
ncbi:MAG: hypothetical protein KDF61_17745, partial [Rhodocyclaceae bacterium]|nr:hypothetical protein [Rhodocyclaceae bacterium]